MNFGNIITGVRARMEKRQRYEQLAAEIRALSHRDLADMRADRGDMLRDLRRHFYG